MNTPRWYSWVDEHVRAWAWFIHELVGRPFVWLLCSPLGQRIRQTTEPNHWTLLRFPMAIIIAVLLFLREDGWAIVMYILSVLTDRFDGEFARLEHRESSFGELLDTTADSVLQSAVLLSVNWRYPILWESHTGLRLPLIAVSLEAVRLLGALILRMMPRFTSAVEALQPNMSGKFKMAAMALSVVCLLSKHVALAQQTMWIAIALSCLSMTRHLHDALTHKSQARAVA